MDNIKFSKQNPINLKILKWKQCLKKEKKNVFLLVPRPFLFKTKTFGPFSILSCGHHHDCRIRISTAVTLLSEFPKKPPPLSIINTCPSRSVVANNDESLIWTEWARPYLITFPRIIIILFWNDIRRAFKHWRNERGASFERLRDREAKRGSLWEFYGHNSSEIVLWHHGPAGYQPAPPHSAVLSDCGNNLEA